MSRSSSYRRGQVVAVALVVAVLALALGSRGVIRATRSVPVSDGEK